MSEAASGNQGDRALGEFTNNLARLLGLHALSQNFAATLVGVSGQTMSSWLTGKSVPSLGKAVAVAELFEINAQRLIAAPFSDLLIHELADPERFARVERKVEQARQAPARHSG